jgi:plastocyanin
MRRRLPVLFAVLAALLLAGCGGSDPVGGTTRPTSATTPATDVDSGDGAEVTIRSFSYMPEEAVVRVGTTVTWTNQDDFAHTVTAGTPEEPSDAFPEGVMGELGQMNGKGVTYSFAFEEPGTYDYFCRFHPQQMRATVTVTG